VTETNIFQLSQPGTFSDPLTEVLRNGARALLTQAVEAEVAAFLSCHADLPSLFRVRRSVRTMRSSMIPRKVKVLMDHRATLRGRCRSCRSDRSAQASDRASCCP
jgi:hypothetical protein